jgi:hypothetical protein
MQHVEGGLNRLQKLIVANRVHSTVPVSVAPLLERFHVKYSALPEYVDGVAARKRAPRRHYVSMAFNHVLQEPERSAVLRETQAHEFIHLFARHPGNYWVKWGYQKHSYAEQLHWLDARQEAECRLLSAYLLIPAAELFEHWNEDAAYIAAVCDVPEHLVPVRWDVYRKYGR